MHIPFIYIPFIDIHFIYIPYIHVYLSIYKYV